MRPTISQLRRWNPGELTDAGTTAQDNATVLDGAVDAVVRAMYANTQWSGKTRFAAQDKVKEEQDHANEVRNVLQQIADETKDAAHDLAHSRTFVLGQVDGALHDVFLSRHDAREDAYRRLERWVTGWRAIDW